MLQSVGQNSKKSIAHQLCCSYCTCICPTDLRITNHRGHKFPPSLRLLSFKTWVKWPPVLTTTASFSSVFFQLLQYSRQHPSFSACRAALMSKADLIFPAVSLRFVDLSVQFCFCMRSPLSQVWQWHDFSGPITIL